MTSVLEAIIYDNQLQGCTYVEPFAGGAGAGLKLLCQGHVDRVIINDADRAIACFWKSVMKRTDELAELILETPLTIEAWEAQRAIYRAPGRCSEIRLGFAAFYLNRCNRSGIIKNGGPIGGIAQAGKWKIDARFNREQLVTRVRELADYGDRITVLCQDACSLIESLNGHVGNERCFVYADPPYYLKGRELYFSHYADKDHAAFANQMSQLNNVAWVMTYDDHPRIRELYTRHSIQSFKLRYSAHADSPQGGEVLIAPQQVTISKSAKNCLTLLAGNRDDN